MAIRVPYIGFKCPNCGNTFSFGHAGLKVPYGKRLIRCNKCNRIYATGEYFYDDYTEKEKLIYKNKILKEFLVELLLFGIPIILILLFPKIEILSLTIIISFIGACNFIYSLVRLLKSLAQKLKIGDYIDDKELYSLELEITKLIKDGVDKREAVLTVLEKYYKQKNEN